MQLSLFVLLLCVLGYASSAVLESYNVDKDSVSVSGLSAGGFMAVQMHVAYSSLFVGVGVFAGGPFWCAKGILTSATTTCMVMPYAINVASLQAETESYASTGEIDAIENMRNDKVYLFSGTKDTTVNPGVVEAAEEYYQKYVDANNIITSYNLETVHGFPTMKYGTACDKTNYQHYINNCNYDGAYIMLQSIFGDLKRSDYTTDPLTQGTLMTFDQTEFFGGAFANIGLDDEGYIFVPNQCADRSVQCRLHLSLHGCKQAKETIQDTYVTQTGYMEAAVANNLIIVSPQVKKDFVNNPNGCFDWWGYTNKDYAKKSGEQMDAIYRMLTRVMGSERHTSS